LNDYSPSLLHAFSHAFLHRDLGIRGKLDLGDRVETATSNRGKGGLGSITVNPSAPAALLALAELRQPAMLLFSVANKLVGVCAWLVLGAAVPRNLYRLKSDKRNLDYQIVWRFTASVPISAFSPART
jgi:hypothetical protein